MENYIVYRTENRVNGKFYYGVHNSNEDDGYLGSGKLLKQAINKHGKDNFIRRTIKSFNTKEEAYKFESIIVDEDFINRKDCYNIAPGGNGGRIQSTNSLKRMGKRYKGKGNPFYGKTHSDEVKEDRRQSFTGKQNPRAREVINVKTGEIHDTATVAAKSIGYDPSHLSAILRGKYSNKTDFKYND